MSEQNAEISKSAPVEVALGMSKDDIQEKTLDFTPLAFSRNSADQQAWDTVKARIESEFNLTVDGTTTGVLSTFSRRIESGFSFQAEPLDDDFSLFHVEPLIDQAADLLDRGVRDRATWDDLAVKMLELALELAEYKELDEIHTEEERAGLYDVPLKQSDAEHRAEWLNSEYQQFQEDLTEALIRDFYSDDEVNKQYNAARKSAWIAGLVAYLFQGQIFEGFVKYNWDGVEKAISELAIEAAEDMSSHQLLTTRRSLGLQKEIFDTLTEVSKRKLPGLQARADWDMLNANFMRRRTLVARRYQDIKARIATDSDGILNYHKRLVPLKMRFNADFRSALARLRAIQQGLKDLYGYAVPFPSDENSVDFFDQCLLWTRTAIQYLVRFSRQDQSIVIPVSLRQALGDDKYREGRRTGQWELPMGEDQFAGLHHVRIRGLSAFVDGDDAKRRLWHLVINVPASATISHLNGDVVTIDQSTVSACRLARVRGREAQREPDVAGISSLYNTSPIGIWTVRMLNSVPKGQFSDLMDIQLDMHLAYRSVK